MLSRSIEDYIKAIYSLELQHQRATTQRVAERLGVKMASVSGMIKHLAAEGYVRHTPYHGAKVTQKGRTVALSTIRRHRLVELFLVQVLGLPWDEVDADAERLEHALSDRLVERIYEYLGRPEFDPHGSPIPREDGSVPDREGIPLAEAPAGRRSTVVEVFDRDPGFLRHLTSLGIRIGTTVTIRRGVKPGDRVTIEVGRRRVTLEREAAERIRVR